MEFPSYFFFKFARLHPTVGRLKVTRLRLMVERWNCSSLFFFVESLVDGRSQSDGFFAQIFGAKWREFGDEPAVVNPVVRASNCRCADRWCTPLQCTRLIAWWPDFFVITFFYLIARQSRVIKPDPVLQWFFFLVSLSRHRFRLSNLFLLRKIRKS